MNERARRFSLGLVGARGHTGAELLRLIEHHPAIELAFVSSRLLAGQRLRDTIDDSALDLRYEDLDAQAVGARGTDVVILALPNGLAAGYVEQLAPGTIVIDLSADFRFDDRWTYGLPEHFRAAVRGARRIANPGCYATGAQLAIRPLLDLLAAPPVVFGVSGYSGAGTTPSERNDPERLRDNLLPYALTNHTHEREIARHLGRPARFMPHVASFFRGITLTISFEFERPVTRDELAARYHAAYAREPLVRWSEELPDVRAAMLQHHATLGGLSVSPDGGHAVVIATLDNLLKGAATQAMQNLNLALDLDELTGIVI